MTFTEIINKMNGAIWALPVILLLLGVSIAYNFAMHFGTLRNWKLQLNLLKSSGGKSDEGISPFQRFVRLPLIELL